MEAGSGALQCVGRLEIAEAKKPVGFLCGTLPVPTDAPPLFLSPALLPSTRSTGAPRYQMLPAETDLNTLPLLSSFREKVFPAADKAGEDLHWESSSITQNLTRKCEALAVSGLVEYGDDIDVVAPADILKQIFKIPYSKAQLSIAVHRIGDTLILNTGPDFEEGEKIFRRQSNQSKGSNSSIFLNFAMHSVRAEACDCPPSHHPSTEKQSSSTILPGHFGHREGPYVSSSSAHVDSPQYIDESASRKSSQGNRDKFFWGTKQNKQKNRRSDPPPRTSQVGEKPRCPVQESEKYRRAGDNGFLRVLFWQFHNFRMLLGSDLLLFSDEKYVAVSLHLWDVARQVTPLTWLEAWLDNVMASVPELAICYHRNGVVQGYELLKTDDIFLVKGVSDDGTPAFHPQTVQQNGLSVLRFLQDNCKQDPGAYWLYKSAGEDVIQLFDLSVIPKNHSADDHDKSSSSFLSLMHKGRRESLFSLGTLLYRVAHKLSLSKAPDNRARCAKFFKKCLDFLSEQDHLVVRAYAHEQFARLILKCYEELNLTSESFLLESEVTVTDLEDESSEFSLGMFGSVAHDEGPSQSADDSTSTKDGMMLQSSGSETLGTSKTEAGSSLPLDISESMEVKDIIQSSPICETHDSLVMCQVPETIPQVVKTIADPISSKLAAIHHVSQAIKSLRWKRQLQNTDGDMIDHGNMIHERSSPVDFSSCACGDADCIEVCDIREWLAKSKIDQKLWNLVLLLGESYLALGEAYKDDSQLHQALKVVEVACLVYGSMPQHLEDARFISSMAGSSSCQLKSKYGRENETMAMDSTKELRPKLFEECYSTDQFSPNYLFWAKTWTLVGDVYVEYYITSGKESLLQERTTSGSELKMSNEVVREVKRLKKKLGQYQQNCSTCSLVNCSCQSDRASSGNSASSSSGDATSPFGRKLSRKSNTRNSLHSLFGSTQYDNSLCKVESTSGDKHLPNSRDVHMPPVETCRIKENSETSNIAKSEDSKQKQTAYYGEAVSSELSTKDATKVRQGGIFKFLNGPKVGEAENNLLAAIDCYNAAIKALDEFPNGSTEFHSIFKKKGWACNELGRYRLENKNLTGAEVAFIEAITAFKEVSDSTNIILINCNLGHGRRAVAEELVSKMDELKKFDLLLHAYKQALETAKLEYFESLRYYMSAKTELISVVDGVDTLLHNEVYTQYAHTYLRLGMLLAREALSTEGYESGRVDELSPNGKMKEQIKPEMSASDAFREALSTYESLGELRKQEATFAHFQLACYYRDSCMKFLDLEQKQVKLSKCENNYRQRAKWYASLAEKNWQKSIEFYGPNTHPVMYLNILLEQSALALSLSSLFHSNTMLETALHHLLEGRHVAESKGDCSYEQDPEIVPKFWNQLQALLKSMLAASLSGSSNKSGGLSQVAACSKAGDAGKLREMYRISLKSTDLSQLHAMHKLWNS